MCPIVVESENIGQRKCGLHPSIVAQKSIAKKFLPKFEIKPKCGSNLFKSANKACMKSPMYYLYLGKITNVMAYKYS